MLGYLKEKCYYVSYICRRLIFTFMLHHFLYCTGLNLSNADEVLMEGRGWSKSDFGIIMGALFWTYGIGQFVNGRVSEIVEPAKFVVASGVLSVAANMLFSFQTLIVVMAILWGLNGYFQLIARMPSVAVLTKWWLGPTHGLRPFC